MAIVVCGLSHKTVPLDVLERVAFLPDALPKALARLIDADEIHEGVILSTCNRTEVYVSVHRFHPAVEAVRRFLSDSSGVDQGRIGDGLYTYYDEAAARHLFGVSSGIDSMVVGEPQILGQVREAYRVAHEEGTARRLLGALFMRALRVGKRARTETAIARHVISLPQAAARVAAGLCGGLDTKTVVVVGAGRMGELAARAASEGGCGRLVIANRTRERAETLAARLRATAAGLDELPRLLGAADVVVCVTSAREPVLERPMLERVSKGRRLVAIDVGVPRNVDPAARDLDTLVLRDLDDLRSVVEEGAERRRAELPKVRAIVEEEVEAFSAWERSLALGPAIQDLRAWAERIRRREVERLVRKGGGDPETIDRMTRSLVNKLLHRPMTQMRELVRGRDGQVYLEAFREIFDLDDADASG